MDIAAPRLRCFDLARSIEFHIASMPGTAEQAVGARRTGLLGLGDQVTWRARHFGITLTLTSRITSFNPSADFRDSQVSGPFLFFDHDHEFLPHPSDPQRTRMTDHFTYRAPYGILGRLAERLAVTSYLTRLLTTRAGLLRAAAESDEWRRYLHA
jgi:ligand-binding SRPBCC domain-containing protein